MTKGEGAVRHHIRLMLAGLAALAVGMATQLPMAAHAAGPVLRHVTQAEAVAAVGSIADKQLAPGVVLFGEPQVPSPPDPPTLCVDAPFSAPTPSGEVLAIMQPVIGGHQGGFVGPWVYVFSSAAQQMATLTRFAKDQKACPRKRFGWFDAESTTVSFTQVSAGSYRLGGWHGYLTVQDAKVHGKAERAYDGYVGQGNVLVELRVALPAQVETASAEKALYTLILRDLTNRLAGLKS